MLEHADFVEGERLAGLRSGALSQVACPGCFGGQHVGARSVPTGGLKPCGHLPRALLRLRPCSARSAAPARFSRCA